MINNVQINDFLEVVFDYKKSSVLQNEQEKPKPFVKWVGGKRGIIKELTSRLPRKFNRYYEPFVGGGALLFELIPKQAFISDMNQELITTYLVLKTITKI